MPRFRGSHALQGPVLPTRVQLTSRITGSARNLASPARVYPKVPGTPRRTSPAGDALGPGCQGRCGGGPGNPGHEFPKVGDSPAPAKALHL